MSGGSDIRASDEAKALLIATLTSFLEGRLEVVEVARKLAAQRFAFVGEHLDEDWRVFVAIDSETDHLPLGDVRKHWAADALARKDAERRETEAFYRDHLLSAARSLLRRYEPNG
jgi:hypothetical protein